MASPSATSNVGNPYTKRSSRSSLYTVKVQFRLAGGVYGVLRSNTGNVSELLRGLVYEYLEKLPTYWRCEEVRLEVEVARLCDELRRVHGYASALLKHGSYAKAYLEKLKGGRIGDRRPYHLIEPPPEVSKGELETVESVVEYRELIAGKMNEKLKRLMELKKASLSGGDRIE